MKNAFLTCLAVLSLTFGGCGGPDLWLPDGGIDNAPSLGTAPGTVASNKSGTRIRRRVGKTSDGAEVELGWFDTQLNTPCEFVAESHGSPRCLPIHVPAVQTQALPYYADASCAQEGLVLDGTGGCRDLRFAQRLGRYPACGVPDRTFYRVGPRATKVYLKTTTGCVESTTGYEVYARGELVPSSAFAEAIEEASLKQ